MLDALDETIKAVLRELGGLNPDEVDIAFDAPDREWAARVGKPTVNCYLYDIRENLDLRGAEWSVERQPNGRTATKRQIPRRFDLSYVCTAWTADVEDEHRLLWRVLATMIRCPELPRHLLQGGLADVGWPVITEVAQPDGLLRDPADVWSALDNRIRPSVNVVVTLPLADSDPLEAPLVLTRRLRFDENGRTVEYIQIGGTVTGEDGSPIADAVVRVRDHAHTTVSTSDGRFWLSGLPAGSYTLVAEAATASAEREVSVPGNGYDIVIGSGSDVARQAGKTGREEKTTRAKKSR
ncbi:MAG: hypothetical protein QOF73_3788 [Thermomicrobiales bacterium]|nr:hypothetical protein [Thermomicrobiales bacterium]